MSWTHEQMIAFLRSCQRAEAYCAEIDPPVPFRWPGLKTIARISGMTHQGVAHVLKQLEAAGRIRKTQDSENWRAARWEVVDG